MFKNGDAEVYTATFVAVDLMETITFVIMSEVTSNKFPPLHDKHCNYSHG